MWHFSDDDIITTRAYGGKVENIAITPTTPGKPTVEVYCHPGTGAVRISIIHSGSSVADQMIYVPHGMLRSLIQALALVQERTDNGWPVPNGFNIN